MHEVDDYLSPNMQWFARPADTEQACYEPCESSSARCRACASSRAPEYLTSLLPAAQHTLPLRVHRIYAPHIIGQAWRPTNLQARFKR